MRTKKVRQVRIDGDIAYVPLTRGYEAIVDAIDAPHIGKWNWYAEVMPHTVYAVRTIGASPNKKSIRMHKVISGLMETEVDHKDCNGLNNRRKNLRPASRSQNQQNQRIKSNNTSGFKGVYWVKKDKKWLSRIQVGGKRVQLGYFSNPEDAHDAYCIAAAEMHGRYARTE